MELNRNHYFVLGMILVFLGLQFRFVESFTLTPKATKFLAEKFPREQPAVTTSAMNLLSVAAPPSVMTKKIQPPRWISFSLLSVGAVLVLYSIVLKKPGS